MSKTIDRLIKIVNRFGVGAPLATLDQIKERFDENTAIAINEDRRIVFWHYGLPAGAIIGSALTMFIGWLV